MKNQENSGFWSHVETFRWLIIRMAAVLIGIAVLVFTQKSFIFNDLILAPLNENFITYKIMSFFATQFHLSAFTPEVQNFSLINTQLSAQIFIHLKTSFFLALILAFPYIVIEAWFFIAPALYPTERKYGVRGAVAFLLLFYLGCAISYFIIFPIVLNFLGNYQVSDLVPNMIDLNSYISSFLSFIFMMGIFFELPILAYFLAKINILKASFLINYRKFAIIIILILAAIVTPSDVFSMILVAIPLLMLYECSIIIVKRVERKDNATKSIINN